MWVVTINNPYYPKVEYFDDEANALKCFNEFVQEHVEDGQYDVLVSIAKVEKIQDINTVY